MSLRIAALLFLALAAYAASRVSMPFDDARPVLQQLAPPDLRNADAKQFAAWTRDKDLAIRNRLEQGDLDSMVNLLLYGTSFTAQPRMTIENLAAETRDGRLRARLTDLLAALQKPGNPRLQFIRDLLAQKHFDPASQTTGTFILDNLQRVLKERVQINQQIAAQDSSNNVFSSRGVSLDTTIFPNYAIDAALREAKTKGLIQTVSHAAIIGPGLDFIDKESGYDYYPLQTLQPFALADSFAALKLGAPAISILDISARVRFHIQGAVQNAKAGRAYEIQLPRNTATPWLPEVLDYWKHFGDALAMPAQAIPVPANLTNVDTRAVRFPTAVVRTLDEQDLNIVSQRLKLPAAERYDVIVATNILVYYTPFEQALALANIASMLKPGGLLLTNDELPTPDAIPMRLANRTEVLYTAQPPRGDTVFAYRKP